MPPPLSQQKATNWSVTMWLTEETGYTSSTDVEAMIPPQWFIEGQEEKGKESGKLHFQLRLKTPHIRGSAVMKVFPKCHVEVARNPIALQQYVHKEDTRVGEFKTIQNRSPQWHSVVSQFADWVVRDYPDLSDEPKEEHKLSLWDDFIRYSILEGMLLDVLGVNPQYRSCIIRYWSAYIQLAKTRISVGQTDRQTDVPSSPSTIISDSSITSCPVESTLVSPVPVRRRQVRLVALDQ